MLNTFSISTSADGKSWEHWYCCFVIQISPLFTQTKHLLILHFLALVRRHLLQPELFETTNLKRILRSSHQKKFVKMGVVNVLAQSLKNTYKSHFFGKVADRIFLRINFFIDTTQPTFQRPINVVATFWITIEITLIRSWKLKQNPKTYFQRCSALIQCRCPTLKQY